MQETENKTGQSLKRSMIKAISWRVVGSIDTFLLSIFVISTLPWLADNFFPWLERFVQHESSSVAGTAGLIAFAEVITKLILYVGHEQAWGRVSWGKASDDSNTHFRTFVKTIVWRVIAFLDTTFLAWFFTGSVAMALSIGALEVATKFFLYYLHERSWNKIKLYSNLDH